VINACSSFSQIFQALREATALRSLRLAGNRLADSGGLALVDTLSMAGPFPHLTLLDVADNGIHAPACTILVLRAKEKLEDSLAELNLSGNPTTAQETVTLLSLASFVVATFNFQADE